MIGERFLTAAVCTLLLAGSWCLSSTPKNLFWLSLSKEVYLYQVAFWSALFACLYGALWAAGRRSRKFEDRTAFFLLMASPWNLLDFGMRSVFGETSAWPNTLLAGWSVATLSALPAALLVAWRFTPARATLGRLCRAALLPCAVLLYHAVPVEFAVVETLKPRGGGQGPPVHLMLFDMLSSDVLYEDGRVSDAFPHFRALADHSDVYLRARSPSGTTGQAVARLLTGIDFESVGHVRNLVVVRQPGEEEDRPLKEHETVFSIAKGRGYDVFLRSFAYPYVSNFGNAIQDGRIHPFNTLWRLGMHSLVWPMLSPGGLQHQATTDAILNAYLKRIEQGSKGTMFFVHWNIPHDPFIFDRHGNKLSRAVLTKHLIRRPDRMAAYRDQMVGTDAVLGRLVAAMKENGSYDEALLVVLGDHNVGELGLDMTRVPLLIKRPGQKKFFVIRSEAGTIGLFDYLKGYLASGNLDRSVLLKQAESPGS